MSPQKRTASSYRSQTTWAAEFSVPIVRSRRAGWVGGGAEVLNQWTQVRVVNGVFVEFPEPHTGTLDAMLVWIDLEMTGLDARTDVIVEIATLITDDELNIVAEGPDLVVHQPEAALANMDKVVVDMHTSSGLLDQIRASTLTLEDAGAQTLAFIKEYVPKPRTVPLCGNSIGMDRRFLDAYLPEIEQWLHYRSIDVSTIKELSRRWYPKALSDAPRKDTAHRAMDDIRESVAELVYWRTNVFREQ